MVTNNSNVVPSSPGYKYFFTEYEDSWLEEITVLYTSDAFSPKDTRRGMTLNSRLNAVYLFAVANVKPRTEKEMRAAESPQRIIHLLGKTQARGHNLNLVNSLLTERSSCVLYSLPSGGNDLSTSRIYQLHHDTHINGGTCPAV